MIAWFVVMYHIATMTLPRVCLKENPSIVGVIVQKIKIDLNGSNGSQEPGKVLVHWGVADKNVVRTWHTLDEIEPVVA